MDSFTSRNLRQVNRTLEEARNASKWLFFWDKQGSVDSLLRYQSKSTAVDLAYQVTRTAAGAQSVDEVLEILRKHVICAGAAGSTLLVDLLQTKPDFGRTFTSEDFPAPDVFNQSMFMNTDLLLSMYKE